MEHNCDNCLNAFRAADEEYVLCGHWQKEFEKDARFTDEKLFVKCVIFAETDLENIALGFGYRRQYNKLDSHWLSKGTVSESIMTNSQILVKKTESCKFYRIIKDRTHDCAAPVK